MIGRARRMASIDTLAHCDEFTIKCAFLQDISRVATEYRDGDGGRARIKVRKWLQAHGVSHSP